MHLSLSLYKFKGVYYTLDLKIEWQNQLKSLDICEVYAHRNNLKC